MDIQDLSKRLAVLEAKINSKAQTSTIQVYQLPGFDGPLIGNEVIPLSDTNDSNILKQFTSALLLNGITVEDAGQLGSLATTNFTAGQQVLLTTTPPVTGATVPINYRLNPSSSATPDGLRVIAATGGGNWEADYVYGAANLSYSGALSGTQPITYEINRNTVNLALGSFSYGNATASDYIYFVLPSYLTPAGTTNDSIAILSSDGTSKTCGIAQANSSGTLLVGDATIDAKNVPFSMAAPCAIQDAFVSYPLFPTTPPPSDIFYADGSDNIYYADSPDNQYTASATLKKNKIKKRVVYEKLEDGSYVQLTTVPLWTTVISAPVATIAELPTPTVTGTLGPVLDIGTGIPGIAQWNGSGWDVLTFFKVFNTYEAMNAFTGAAGQMAYLLESGLIYAWRTDTSSPQWVYSSGAFPTAVSKINVDAAYRAGFFSNVLQNTIIPVTGAPPLLTTDSYPITINCGGTFSSSANPLFNATLTGDTSSDSPATISNIDTTTLAVGMFVRSDAFAAPSLDKKGKKIIDPKTNKLKVGPGGLSTPTQTITITAISAVGPGSSITVSLDLQTFDTGQTFAFNTIDVSSFLAHATNIIVNDADSNIDSQYIFQDPGFQLIGPNSSGGSDVIIVSNIDDLQDYDVDTVSTGQIFRVTTTPTIPIIPGASINLNFLSEFLDYEYLDNYTGTLVYNGFSVLETLYSGDENTSCFRLVNAQFTFPVNNSDESMANQNLQAPFVMADGMTPQPVSGSWLVNMSADRATIQFLDSYIQGYISSTTSVTLPIGVTLPSVSTYPSFLATVNTSGVSVHGFVKVNNDSNIPALIVINSSGDFTPLQYNQAPYPSAAPPYYVPFQYTTGFLISGLQPGQMSYQF